MYGDRDPIIESYRVTSHSIPGHNFKSTLLIGYVITSTRISSTRLSFSTIYLTQGSTLRHLASDVAIKLKPIKRRISYFLDIALSILQFSFSYQLPTKKFQFKKIIVLVILYYYNLPYNIMPLNQNTKQNSYQTYIIKIIQLLSPINFISP